MNKIGYKKVLLKLSGEMLLGNQDKGIDFEVLEELCGVIKNVQNSGVKVGVVLGAGNIWRYRDSKDSKIARVKSDQIGMMGTIINALAMAGKLESMGAKATAFSAIEVPDVCETYTVRRAVRLFEEGQIVVLAGGTGNPFFTTDSAAALRALELNCDALLKGTKVDGIYDSDPVKNPDAKFYKTITFSEVLEKDLKVMDAAAISLCRDNNMPVKVFSIQDFGNIKRVVEGEDIGSTVQ
ncbi:UMP kinase [Patescibacteria group bacterium]|nr:UMP kinase [Patescibacteria group bacterium]